MNVWQLLRSTWNLLDENTLFVRKVWVGITLIYGGKMKFRIIQRVDGKYKVQRKLWIFGAWQDVFIWVSDYQTNGRIENWEGSSQREDYQKGVFGDIELAKNKVKELMKDFQDDVEKCRLLEADKKLQKQFKVIEEIEV